MTAKPIQISSDVFIGNRIPFEFFATKGRGQSDITIHAGSYHLALKEAGIESYNIITYSSILPNLAKKIDKPKNLIHGSVMETIMAVGHLEKGVSGAAGITYGWLYDKTTNERYGGLVCEHAGEMTETMITKQLNNSLQELYTNGFSDQYNLKDVETITESFQPDKKHGTVLVALCFTSYKCPIILR